MISEQGHRRFNPLTGEWLLVSPHRAKRPWQGKQEQIHIRKGFEYLDDCYLCPGNERAGGEKNPEYKSTFVFRNDFSALINEDETFELNESGLLIAKSEKGICMVICFSPKHNVTLAEMQVMDIENVIRTWREEYISLGNEPFVNYVQIFENKGDVMGCSNPHPHGQIWAQETIPGEPAKENKNQLEYFNRKGTTLLGDYLKIEIEKNERIIFENEGFVLLVPFWAVWPFETMIVSKKPLGSIAEFSDEDISLFAEILKITTVKYDNVFEVSFPYSAGIHQAPTEGKTHPEWHFHMHFYPPLLRSASVKKFMVGYELLAEPQRDITPERSAEILRKADVVHFLDK